VNTTFHLRSVHWFGSVPGILQKTLSSSFGTRGAGISSSKHLRIAECMWSLKIRVESLT